MLYYQYDGTFEGVLTCVFDAYASRRFPHGLLGPQEAVPLLATDTPTVRTDEAKATRVYAGLKKRLSRYGLNRLAQGWLSEAPERADVLFRVIRKIFASDQAVEQDYGDPDILALERLSRKVYGEYHSLLGFLRFQKTAQGVYFAAIAPRHDVLAMMLPHFTDRFADQRWIIYDTRRRQGYLHEQGRLQEVTLDAAMLQNGRLPQNLLDDTELLFQALWKNYCQAIAIKERINPRLQRSFLPERFRPYMVEMDGVGKEPGYG